MIRRAALFVAAAMLTTSCAALGLTQPCGGTEIIGIFEQVADLVEAATVQSSDVEIGRVSKIELDGWNARVSMCIDEDERIPADVNLVVRTTSLLGEKFVDIRPQDDGPPFLEDGAVVGLENTSKATELEEVFAKLASVLGTGNLEQINRFTTAQANILRGNEAEVREVFDRLHRFTEVLDGRRGQITASIDSLDSVARTVLDDSVVLQRFLDSFAGSSRVLNNQREGLEDLLIALDRFTNVSVQLLNSTEQGLDSQLRDLRPVLRTAVENSSELRRSLRTLATFSQWFPETMPGDYLQLDVCQAPPEHTAQGVTCPQSVANDDPDRAVTGASAVPENAVQYILRVQLTEGRR